MNWPSSIAFLIAVVALGMIGGLCCAYFIRSWLGRVLLPVAAGILVVALLVALCRGRSDFLERITGNFAWYVENDPLGFAAFAAALMFGLTRRRGKSTSMRGHAQ